MDKDKYMYPKLPDGQKASYLYDKLMFDLEYDSIKDWVKSYCDSYGLQATLSQAFRQEFKIRLDRVYKLLVPVEVFEMIEVLDARSRDFWNDNTESTL
jgi:hypothetical protein